MNTIRSLLSSNGVVLMASILSAKRVGSGAALSMILQEVHKSNMENNKEVVGFTFSILLVY